MSSDPGQKTSGDIEAGLRRLKPAVADRFVALLSEMEEQCDPEQFQRWQMTCWQLADAGWHGWETANDYMQVSTLYDISDVIQSGEYCLQFVENSFEPGRTYLSGILQLERGERVALEATGDAVRARFQQAANLHNHYFRAAFAVAKANHLEGFEAWCQIVIKSCGRERADLLKFLQLSEQGPERLWSEFLPLASDYYPNVLHLQSFSLELQRAMLPVEESILGLAAKFSGESIEVWLSALKSTLPVLGEVSSRTLMGLLESLDEIDHCTALVEVAEKLPMEQEWLVAEWLSQRPDTENQKAIVAYLQLGSAQSEAQLQELEGRVRLHEELRSIQLFAEGLMGNRLQIEAGESLPASDGLTIHLPSEIAIYPSRSENYRWLKSALMHQLGCYEFGTFDHKTEGAYAVFAREFNRYDQPMLAEQLFAICEASRIDWRLEAEYPGSAIGIREEKRAELGRRVTENLSARRSLTEALVFASLDDLTLAQAADFGALLAPLKLRSATVQDSFIAAQMCYELIAPSPIDLEPIPLVGFRGHVAFDDASMNLQLTALEELQAELTEEFADEEEGIEMTGATDSPDLDVDELEAGDVEDPSAILPADDEISGDDFDHVDDPVGLKRLQELMAQRQVKEQSFRYDEWDFTISDYRRRFCTLYEFRQLEQDFDFVPNTLAEHRALANRVRRQLNMLRPELLRKVKGVIDGEELDLERAIEAMVDKKSGVSPSEHIYVQRQRKERDVAALFLLDMSASTDDLIEPEPTVYIDEDDDYLHSFPMPGEETEPKERGKTILDLEKESVVLMAEALEGLGDSYAVCGFSGYGRDRIEYYVCKDFDEPYNYHAKANIGGIKPCRSTRMGPAIRHATKMLSETESRIKALIIISDGYPQDFDYGQDRNSKDYGIKDTTKALNEASQKGVQSFCLTVDPSGHDYLREMCPDQQYMVMQDIMQLPDELSKVYRGLTS